MREFRITIVALIVALPLAHAQNQIVTAGYDIPVLTAVARGQVLTLFVRGLKAPDAAATSIPLPTTLAGVSVRVKSNIRGYPDRLPIFSIRSFDFCEGRPGVVCQLTHVTVQIPTEPTCVPTGQGVPNECTFDIRPGIILTVEENGIPGQDFPVIVVFSKPQILNACQTIFGRIGGSCLRFVTHTDGTRVSGTNPAHPGETVVIYAVGLGPTIPAVKTGEAAPAQARAAAVLRPLLTISHRLVVPPASPAPPVIWSPMERWIEPAFVGLVPGYVGLYQINVTLPDRLPERVHWCYFGDFDANTRIAIGTDSLGPPDGETFVDICVQP